MANILVTGTHESCVLALGSTLRDDNCCYYAVTNAKNHTAHSIHISPYAASLVRAYALTRLNSVHKIALCVHLPHMSMVHAPAQHEMDTLLRTEWFFIVDMIRHSIELLHEHAEKKEKEKPLLVISLPEVRGGTHNGAELAIELFCSAAETVVEVYARHASQINIVGCTQSEEDVEHTQLLRSFLREPLRKNKKHALFFRKNPRKFSFWNKYFSAFRTSFRSSR